MKRFKLLMSSLIVFSVVFGFSCLSFALAPQSCIPSLPFQEPILELMNYKKIKTVENVEFYFKGTELRAVVRNGSEIKILPVKFSEQTEPSNILKIIPILPNADWNISLKNIDEHEVVFIKLTGIVGGGNASSSGGGSSSSAREKSGYLRYMAEMSEGRRHMDNGEYEEANDCFTRAFNIDLRIEGMEGMEERIKAIRAMDEVQTILEPRREDKLLARLRLDQIKREEREGKEAEARRYPEYMAEGRRHMENREYEEANDCFTRAYQATSNTEEEIDALEAMTQAKESLGKITLARDDQRLVRSKRDEIQREKEAKEGRYPGYMAEGRRHMENGEHEEAKDCFTRAYNVTSNKEREVEVLEARAEAKERLGETTSAQEDRQLAHSKRTEIELEAEAREEAEARGAAADELFKSGYGYGDENNDHFDSSGRHIGNWSFSPLSFTPSARMEEERLEKAGQVVVPQLTITKAGGVISQIKFNGTVYAVERIEDIPRIEARNYARAYIAANKVGLISAKDFIYNFKFYENTPSLGSTHNVTAESAEIEINRVILSDANYLRCLPRLLEVIKKEDLRTENIPALIAQINEMLREFGQADKFLPATITTVEELMANKEVFNKFETLLRLLSYKKLSEKFVELSTELGVFVNWTEYWRSIDYLYNQVRLLMNDNAELRQQLHIDQPFNFYNSDRKLCVDLNDSGVRGVIELYFDNILKETAIRSAA